MPQTIDHAVSFTPTFRPRLFRAMIVGGIIAGTLDEISAMKTFGWGVPRAVASGLMGAKAFDNGAGTWVFGLALHFLIALGAAATYSLLSLRLKFVKENYIVGGIFLGISVFLVMNLIVLPISAFPYPVGPFTADGLRSALLWHVLLIGLPISLSLRFLSASPRM